MDEDPGSSPHIEKESKACTADQSRLRDIAAFAAKQLGVQNHEIDLSVVDSETITSLNSQYRQKKTPTDVLSFPQMEFEQPLKIDSPNKPKRHDGPPETLGDVIICLDEAQKNATRIGQSLEHELAFLLVHGILHLCGYDHIDSEDEQIMLTAQRELMKRLQAEGLVR